MSGFWNILIMIIISFAGGIAVGTSVTSFLIILDIIPRLAQITKSKKFSFLYEISIILGIMTFTLAYLLSIEFSLGNYFALVFGLFMGIFVGMLAAALAEVLNVVPIMANRLKLENSIVYVMLALSLGKVFGSLAYWYFPNIYR